MLDMGTVFQSYSLFPNMNARDVLVAPRKDVGAAGEGKSNVVALPNNWTNYGNIIKGYEKKYKIKINSENPVGSSAEEIQALTSDKGRSSDGPIQVAASMMGLVGTWILLLFVVSIDRSQSRRARRKIGA